MSEVTGCLVVELDDNEVKDSLLGIEEAVDEEILEAWLGLADYSVDDLDEEADDIELYIEGIEQHGKYLLLYTVGEDWVEILALLIKGSDYKLWAKLWHEYAVESYYALSGETVINAVVNLESESAEVEKNSVVAMWQSSMPSDVVALFSYNN